MQSLPPKKTENVFVNAMKVMLFWTPLTFKYRQKVRYFFKITSFVFPEESQVRNDMRVSKLQIFWVIYHFKDSKL